MISNFYTVMYLESASRLALQQIRLVTVLSWSVHNPLQVTFIATYESSICTHTHIKNTECIAEHHAYQN